MTPWARRVLELLLEARAGGEVDFARAWRCATAVARREGLHRPRDLKRPPDEGDDWLPYSSFVRRAYEREWYGEVSMDYAAMPNIGRESTSLARSSQMREHARLLA